MPSSIFAYLGKASLEAKYRVSLAVRHPIKLSSAMVSNDQDSSVRQVNFCIIPSRSTKLDDFLNAVDDGCMPLTKISPFMSNLEVDIR